MAFMVTTKLVLLLAFLFLDKVLQSRQFITIVIILVILSVFVFAFFAVWTMRNRPQSSFPIGCTNLGNKKREPTQKRKSSTREHQQPTHSNPSDGDISSYIEIDNPPAQSIGCTNTHSPCLPNIQEEPDFSGTNVTDQRTSMAPIMCETMAEIEPSGNNGDLKICLTLKSSDVQYQPKRKEANVGRSHSDRLSSGNEYTSMNGEASRSDATRRSMERSITLPRIHMTTAADQSAKCMTVGNCGKKAAGASAELSHEYMHMENVVYTDMDYYLGMDAYQN